MKPFDRTCTSSHNSDLVGNIKGVLVLGESNVCLLITSWSVESVNLLNLEFVKLLAGNSDHLLVSSFVNNEDKSVVVLNGLDSRLTGQWVVDDAVAVVCLWLSATSQKDLWDSLLDLSLWSSEGAGAPDSGFLSGMASLLHSFLSLSGVTLCQIA